jgi:hypothetical protein
MAKVEQLKRERQERLMKKAPPKPIGFVPDILSNVTVPLKMASFDMPTKRLQQKLPRRKSLVLLTQSGEVIQSNRCQADPTSSSALYCLFN